jgi:hypothetical protein
MAQRSTDGVAGFSTIATRTNVAIDLEDAELCGGGPSDQPLICAIASGVSLATIAPLSKTRQRAHARRQKRVMVVPAASLERRNGKAHALSSEPMTLRKVALVSVALAMAGYPAFAQKSENVTCDAS